MLQELLIFDVNCVPVNCCGMRLSDFLYFVPLTLTALSTIVPAASDSYSNLSPHYASSIHGQFGDLYDLNVSCTEPVSIFYNQLHRQVIVHLVMCSCLISARCWLSLNDMFIAVMLTFYKRCNFVNFTV